MITLKSEAEIEKMRRSADIAVAAMARVKSLIRPGVTTLELDAAAYETITSRGGIPNFKGYNGFPGTICASVNEQVVHGIPGDRVLKEGDIISIDLGAILQGYHSDMARTFPVGEIAAEHQKLIDVTKESFYKGLEKAVVGNRIADMSCAIYDHATKYGYGVVEELVGHGIGQAMHEPPDVPNFVARKRGPVLRKGMTLAVEPMINLGTKRVVCADDGWAIYTVDGGYSAHHENTIAITDGEAEILTVYEE